MASRSAKVFIGIKGKVLALDRATGKELWSTELKGSDFVNVVLQDGDLYAPSRGRLYRIDPESGDILWNNDLRGLGYGLVTIAGGSQAPGAEKYRRDQQAAAAAVSASS